MTTPFRQLEPPPGGLDRLRARIEAHDARGVRRRRQVAWALCIVCLCVGAMLLLRRATPHDEATSAQSWAALHPAIALAQDSSLQSGARATAPEQIAIEQVARQGTVTYYRVGVLPLK